MLRPTCNSFVSDEGYPKLSSGVSLDKGTLELGRALFLLAPTLLWLACKPDLCGQRCGADDSCPEGFVCGQDGQYCLPREHPENCAVVTGTERGDDPNGRQTDGGVSPPPGGESEPGAKPPATDPNQGGPSSPAVGAPAASTAIDPAGALPSGQAAPGLDGVAPIAATAPKPEVSPPPTDVCVGAQFIATLELEQADPAIQGWRLVDAPPGFALEAKGSSAEVSGQASVAGDYVWGVDLLDAAGAVVAQPRWPLLVHARPRIVTESLPAICPGEVFAASLLAEAGDEQTYVWTADLDPETGLRVEHDKVSGWFSGAPSGDAIRFSSSVRDAYCASEPRELTLPVLLAGSEHCPAIQVVSDEFSHEQLPPPCLGNDYQEALSATQANTSGTDYQWREVQSSPGLHFDPASATILGRPTGPGELVVQLSDAQPRTIEAHFAIVPRERCWLGYLADDSGARRLELFDARLPDEPSAQRAFPAKPGSSTVLDFAFSSEGTFVVYRLLDESGSASLQLLNLRTWQEEPLVIPGSVSSYNWSSSSAGAPVLAVQSTHDDDSTWLGAVNLERVVTDPHADAAQTPRMTGIQYLTPVAATLRSEQFWLAGASSAFFTMLPEDDVARVAQMARYGAGAVSLLPPRSDAWFYDAARFWPGQNGFFVIDPSASFHHFFASDGGAAILHDAGALIAPSGRFVARAQQDLLQVFRSSDTSWSSESTPWATAEGCTTLLAWAQGRERIACARASAGNQQVVFYDLDDPTLPELTELPRVQGEYRYLAGQHTGEPRAFSQQGSLFVFATDTDLYVVRLDDGTPRIVRTMSASDLGAPPGGFSFSPSGNLLAVHAGGSVLLLNLGGDESAWAQLSASVDEPAGCSEDFVSGSPAWCGGEPLEPVLRWSNASDLLLLRSSEDRLEIADVSFGFPRFWRSLSVDPGCGSGCRPSGSYAFQP